MGGPKGVSGNNTLGGGTEEEGEGREDAYSMTQVASYT